MVVGAYKQGLKGGCQQGGNDRGDSRPNTVGDYGVTPQV